MDDTAPVIKTDIITSSTTSTVSVRIPYGSIVDLESGISKYDVSIYLGDTLIKTDTFNKPDGDITDIFTNLKSDTTYKVVVVATNFNELTTTTSKEVTTMSLVNPTITYTNTPSSEINGYLYNQVINISYSGLNIDSPTYYVKTTRVGVSNISTKGSCGTSTMPSSCTSVSTTSLSANTWYQVSGDISVTYSDTDANNGTIYALTYDGNNYSGSVTGVISKIDRIVPVVSVTVSGKVATISMSDSNSGVSYYCVSTSADSGTCSWTSITNSTSTSASWTASSANTYYAFTKDAMGNISSSSGFSIPASAFCSLSSNTMYNYDYNGGIQSFTAPCTGIYKLEVWGAQGGTDNGGQGGYSIGYVRLSYGSVIYIGVGSQPTTSVAGYNGGTKTGSLSGLRGGGGGATHIGSTNGLLSDTSSSNVYIVAGGGGGGNTSSDTANHVDYGGSGGGVTGGAGTSAQSKCCADASDYFSRNSSGGTQTGGGTGGYGLTTDRTAFPGWDGTYGKGGTTDVFRTGGGSGYYGGGGGAVTTSYTQGGAGGSGYIGGVPAFTYNGVTYSPSTTNGGRTGNGYARITFILFY